MTGVEAWLVDHGSAVLIGVGIVTAFFGFSRYVMPKLRQVGHLVDDLAGEPARPGVAARPGLMERMATVEDYARSNTMDRAQLARVADDVTKLRADVARIDEHVKKVDDDLVAYKNAANDASRDKAATWDAMGAALDAEPPHTVPTTD